MQLSRFRKPGESFTLYFTELRSISKHCNFEDSLETMWETKLSVESMMLWFNTAFLPEKDLTYKKAIESAVQNAKELRPTDIVPTSLPVYHVINSKQAAAVCYHCGKPGHLAPACKHKETVCRKCSRIGHLQHVCHSKKVNSPNATVQLVTKNFTRTVNNKERSTHNGWQQSWCWQRNW